MNKQKDTMIKVSIETREILRQLKIIPRESYDGVIKRLVETFQKMKGGEK